VSENNSAASRQGRADLVRIAKKHRLFLVTVVLPTLLAILYYGFLASDIYISESRFVLRSPERQTATPLGLLLRGTGFTRSQDDAYTVQDFVVSRDALHAVNEKLDLRAAFSRADLFGRFPGLDWDDSFENLHLYYQKMVGVRLDSLSSIGILTVRAFSPQEAQQINQTLLALSEALVNKLNERGRQDMIRFASQEVSIAEEKAKRAALALARFRNEKGVIDPERQSVIPMQQVAKLQDELISAKTQMAQLHSLSRDNSQISSLDRKIKILEDEIARESDRIAGAKGSLASKASEYQRLAIEKDFADKQLASSLASLEQARNEAQRQQLYLERIAMPNLPDAPLEPRRLRAILATLVMGLIVWGVVALLVAGIREHQD
jgi:capsular polysaccharide transport system permease protein